MLGFDRIREFALQQERCCGHCAELAHEAGCAARTWEDADHDFGQADFGLWIVGDKCAVAREGDFKADAEGCAWHDAGNGLAAFVCLWVHACAFDFAQNGVHVHDAVKKAFGWLIARVVLHLGDDIEVHSACEAALFARGDDDAFDCVICKGVIDEV